MNRSRILTLIFAVATVLLIGWIASRTEWKEVKLPTLPTGEAATNPFYAAQHLAEALGAHAERQHVLTSMPETDAVIVLSFWHWSLMEGRRHRLEKWVAAGGRLVLDGSLAGGERELKRWAGIERVATRIVKKPVKKTGDEDEEDEQSTPQPAAPPLLESQGRCALMAVSGSEAPLNSRNQYLLCGIHNGRLISSAPVSWSLKEGDDTQALQVRIGKGSVTLVNATPFVYRWLFSGDHALLFAGMTGLRAGDKLYFLSEEEFPSLPVLIWKYGAPVVVLAAIVFLLMMWRSGARFGPRMAQVDSARRSLGEQILGTGLFTVRLGGGQALHAAAVRALHEVANRHVMRYSQLRGEDRIAALARVTGLDAGALGEAINYSGPRRSAELRRAVELIETARRKILDTQKNSQGAMHG